MGLDFPILDSIHHATTSVFISTFIPSLIVIFTVTTMLDRTYETKQWVSVLLHFAVVCFLLFPLCSPAPMSQSAAGMLDLVPSAQPSAANRANLSTLTDEFIRVSWGHQPVRVGRRSLARRADEPWNYYTSDFQEYLNAIMPNPASWQSPLRLSYGLLGTCFVHPSLNTDNICTRSSLCPNLSTAAFDKIPWVNSTAYLSASAEEIAVAVQNQTLATELFVAPLDTSMLPTDWGAVPVLHLTVLVLLVILMAGTAMPLTLHYVGRRSPMSRFNPASNPVAERVSIKYQQLHCFLLPLLLAAEFVLTVVTRINVGRYVSDFNQANAGCWLPSTVMLDTMASSLPAQVASTTQSETALVARVGTGFDLYYTALASHLALVLMCYELYRDDTSRRRVRINHELNWSAHAELQRAQTKLQAARPPPPQLDLTHAGTKRHEPRTPHGAANASKAHLVSPSDNSPEAITPAARPESINFGCKSSGDLDLAEVRVQIDPISPVSPTSPESRESQGSARGGRKHDAKVKRDASLYSFGETEPEILVSPPRGPPQALHVPPSANSETTFGTFATLQSPWLAEGNGDSVALESLRS